MILNFPLDLPPDVVQVIALLAAQIIRAG